MATEAPQPPVNTPESPVGAYSVPEGRLRLSRSPTAELAGAATRALEQSGMDAHDTEYIILAVPAGQGAALREVAHAAVVAAVRMDARAGG